MFPFGETYVVNGGPLIDEFRNAPDNVMDFGELTRFVGPYRLLLPHRRF
jgi:hypothetical protein